MHRFLFAIAILAVTALIACTEPAQKGDSGAPATIHAVAPESANPTQEPAAATKTPVGTLSPESMATFKQLPDTRPTTISTSTVMTATTTTEVTAATWRGITVASENRCSPYDSDDYRYPPSVEPRIVADLGGIYGPYTGSWFESIGETDIEHIVARSEAHDSGLCAASPETRRRFASDLLNLTLASPSVNRHQKVDKDPSDWLPALNRCWYVDRVIQVRVKYGLTIDRAEAEAIDLVLAGCAATQMVMMEQGTPVRATATHTPTGEEDALVLYDDNRNGRITCAEARAHGIAPVGRGHPAYEYMRDADGDGVVCE